MTNVDIAKIRDLVDYVGDATEAGLDDDTVAIVLLTLHSHYLLRDFPGTPAEYHAKVQVAYAEALRYITGEEAPRPEDKDVQSLPSQSAARPEGIREEPGTALEGAIDRGLNELEEQLEDIGLKLTNCVLMVVADGAGDNLLNACTTGRGFEDDGELLSFMFAHFKHVAGQAGMNVVLAPLGEG